MKTLVISFGVDGGAQCLHTDSFPLADLGSLRVRRASHVTFNDFTQKWEVIWPGSDAVQFTNVSRAACIAWEVKTLNAVIASGQTCPTYAN